MNNKNHLQVDVTEDIEEDVEDEGFGANDSLLQTQEQINKTRADLIGIDAKIKDFYETHTKELDALNAKINTKSAEVERLFAKTTTGLGKFYNSKEYVADTQALNQARYSLENSKEERAALQSTIDSFIALKISMTNKLDQYNAQLQAMQSGELPVTTIADDYDTEPEEPVTADIGKIITSLYEKNTSRLESQLDTATQEKDAIDNKIKQVDLKLATVNTTLQLEEEQLHNARTEEITLDKAINTPTYKALEEKISKFTNKSLLRKSWDASLQSMGIETKSISKNKQRLQERELLKNTAQEEVQKSKNAIKGLEKAVATRKIEQHHLQQEATASQIELSKVESHIAAIQQEQQKNIDTRPALIERAALGTNIGIMKESEGKTIQNVKIALKEFLEAPNTGTLAGLAKTISRNPTYAEDATLLTLLRDVGKQYTEVSSILPPDAPRLKTTAERNSATLAQITANKQKIETLDTALASLQKKIDNNTKEAQTINYQINDAKRTLPNLQRALNTEQDNLAAIQTVEKYISSGDYARDSGCTFLKVPANNPIPTYADIASSLISPRGLIYHNDHLYYADSEQKTLKKIDIGTAKTPDSIVTADYIVSSVNGQDITSRMERKTLKNAFNDLEDGASRAANKDELRLITFLSKQKQTAPKWDNEYSVIKAELISSKVVNQQIQHLTTKIDSINKDLTTLTSSLEGAKKQGQTLENDKTQIKQAVTEIHTQNNDLTAAIIQEEPTPDKSALIQDCNKRIGNKEVKEALKNFLIYPIESRLLALQVAMEADPKYKDNKKLMTLIHDAGKLYAQVESINKAILTPAQSRSSSPTKGTDTSAEFTELKKSLEEQKTLFQPNTPENEEPSPTEETGPKR